MQKRLGSCEILLELSYLVKVYAIGGTNLHKFLFCLNYRFTSKLRL